MKKWQPKNIKLDAKGLAKFLGERESEVMDIVWDQGCVTVREVCDTLCEEREYSFNTIMTIMNRLSEKGLLSKSQDGATYCYTATQEKRSFIKHAIRTVLKSLMEDSDMKEVVKHEKIYKEVSMKER